VKRLVAIDGPSGSGKSTVARGVAEALDLEVLDTGAMYRSVTLAALEQGVDPGDGDAMAAVARRVTVELGAGVTRLDGRDVTAAIRGPAVTAAVSVASAHSDVRAELVGRQRAWVERHGGGVVEGRDIGTVVFPDAPVKVFLTATDEERAQRRQRDERAADRPVEVGEVRDELARRDALDSSRDASPLRAAPDALVIDTTGRDAREVVVDIVTVFESRVGERR
jgi:CMP/dCMP kinase